MKECLLHLSSRALGVESVADRAFESFEHRLAMTPCVQLDAVVLKPNLLG